MFYLGLVKFKNGVTRQVSAGSEKMLEAKIDVITSDIKEDVIRVETFKAEKLNEYTYED